MVKSVAVIGAGASGAITAAALRAENYFDTIRVFERRNTAGGTWNFDPNPGPLPFKPGALPTEIDKPLPIPSKLPAKTPRSKQVRFDQTPIYEGLTTNVPDVAMSFTDERFAYGPFVPHYVPKQYVEGYFSRKRIDGFLVLGTTVERVERLKGERWRLILRKEGGSEDEWWEEEVDAVVVCNGHYSVPFVPHVEGLDAYIEKFPGRVQHSKTYRTPRAYDGQRVLVIGNSASAYDITHQLLESQAKKPVYVSRRTKARWEPKAPPGIEWLPIITNFNHENGDIHFADGTVLKNIDTVIYCTGYKNSYPFWDAKKNGRELWDYDRDVLLKNYQHTFVSDFPTLTFVGIPRALTFRSFEYQAIAIARYYSKRNAHPLPSPAEQKLWLDTRLKQGKEERRKFHQVDWTSGETMEWFGWLYHFAGLPLVEGGGRCPPVLDESVRWAIENIIKYPEWGPGEPKEWKAEEEGGWQVVERVGGREGALWFI